MKCASRHNIYDVCYLLYGHLSGLLGLVAYSPLIKKTFEKTVLCNMHKDPRNTMIQCTCTYNSMWGFFKINCGFF